MNRYLSILLFLLGGLCPPSWTAETARIDDGLSTIRVVEISEASRKVICLPVGIKVHAPENTDREPIVMRVGSDVAVNGQISVLASDTETGELRRRIIQELGPEYTIDYCKSPSWGLEVKTREITLAHRPFMEGSLSGWTFMAMIPAEMASPAVVLSFTGEIRAPALQKKATGATRSVRTMTMSGTSSNTAGSGSLSVSQTVSTSHTAQQNTFQKYHVSSASFPLSGSWEKTILPEP